VHSTLGASQQGSQTSSVMCVLTFGPLLHHPLFGSPLCIACCCFLSLDEDDSEGESDEFESDDSDDLMAGAPHKEPSVIIEDITEQEVRQGGAQTCLCVPTREPRLGQLALQAIKEQHLLPLCAWLHGSVCNLIGQPSSEVRCHHHS
jgi:hypothetical protein